MNKKHAFSRGFTLIELMIVIVILGILMGTILPRLTGAQGRARDTARRADLNNISQALEVYYNDEGEYPDAVSVSKTLDTTGYTSNCLDPADTNASNAAYKLGQYMKGGRIPAPASKSLLSNGCVGMYYYVPLTKDGVDNAAYLLISDMETYQMANFLLTSQPQAFTTYGSVSGSVGADITAANDSTATNTVYSVIP